MPGYGLPKGTKGLLPWKWADDRLKKSHNYWITTVRPDGRPHLMVVWGLWLESVFYFSTGRHSRKAKNLSHRPECIVATEQADQAVIVEGIAEESSAWTRKNPSTPPPAGSSKHTAPNSFVILTGMSEDLTFSD